MVQPSTIPSAGRHRGVDLGLLPLTGRWRGYFLVSLAFALVLAGMLGEWSEGYSYCARCGLQRTDKGFRWLEKPLLEWDTYRETNYQRLYTRYVSPRCAHSWRHTSRSWISLLGGGVACGGGSPRAFWDAGPEDDADRALGSQLPLLEKLADRAKVRLVLLRLADNSRLRPHPAAVARAFRSLKAVSGPEDEAAWWQRFRHVFEPSGM